MKCDLFNVIQILSGSEWTVQFHSASPREMEQSKFYRAIIFLPFHEFLVLYSFYTTDI